MLWAMPTMILYRYRVFDPVRRRWFVSHAMTDQDASRLAGAVRLDWSREERQTPTDLFENCTSAFFRGPGSTVADGIQDTAADDNSLFP